MANDNQYENPLRDVEPEPEKEADKLRRKIKTDWQKVELDASEVLDPRKEFTPPDWALSIRGIPFYAFGDYNYLQGQAGNGKTFTMCIYESVILGAIFGELEYIGKYEKPKVLHIDTEQSEGNVQLHMRRVYHLAGWKQDEDHSDQYKVIMLRETPRPEDRWAKVVKYCDEFKPNFLFVDGMLDVVPSMNDEEGCNLVVSEAGALASIFKLCMIGICHENPSNAKDKENDGPAKPAGHVGSYSQRKASAGQATVKILKDGVIPIFSNNPKKVRNKDYKGFKFTVEDEAIEIGGKFYQIGIPKWIEDAEVVSVEVEEKSEVERDTEMAKATIMNLQWSISGMTRTELDDALKSHGIKSNRMRSDYITLALNAGVISQPKARGPYYLIYDNGNIDTQTNIGDSSIGDDDGKMPF